MNVDQRYKTGEQIHVGDRVEYNRQSGRVVFVGNRGEFADGWEKGDYRTGFMIEFDNGARLLLVEPDGQILLLRPRSP